MKNKRKLYIVTNISRITNRIYFYEFTNKKEAEEFLNSVFCEDTTYDQYNLITIDGNGKYKKAQSIEIEKYKTK